MCYDDEEIPHVLDFVVEGEWIAAMCHRSSLPDRRAERYPSQRQRYLACRPDVVLTSGADRVPCVIVIDKSPQSR